MKRTSCMYTYIPSLLDLPPTPLNPTHLGHHRAPSWAPYAIQQVPTRYPFYTWQWTYVNPNLPIHPPPPSESTRPFPTSASLFPPCKYVHLYHFSRFQIYALIYDICFSLSDLLHSVWQSLGPSTSLQIYYNVLLFRIYIQ